MFHSKMRLLAAGALVALTALWGASVAVADTQVGNQNADANVMASLVSSNPGDSNVARPGDTITATASVESLLFERSAVSVQIFGNLAGTRLTLDKTKLVKMKPGAIWDWSGHIRVPFGTPPGVYSFTVAADVAGSLIGSSATATITVTN